MGYKTPTRLCNGLVPLRPHSFTLFTKGINAGIALNQNQAQLVIFQQYHHSPCTLGYKSTIPNFTHITPPYLFPFPPCVAWQWVQIIISKPTSIMVMVNSITMITTWTKSTPTTIWSISYQSLRSDRLLHWSTPSHHPTAQWMCLVQSGAELISAWGLLR